MKNFILCILIIISTRSYSQTGDVVFNDTILHNLRIDTYLTDWFDTLEADYQLNVSNPDLYPQKYFKCNATWDGIVINNCGFREKGNASNSFTTFGKKKPLKLSFDEFSNEKFDGLKKINLNNFTNDPSLLHNVISFKIMRDAGIIAPRTSYTQLWINGELIGLYLAVENLDKAFLKMNYGSDQDDGNLYKTGRISSVFLDWLGPESAGYKKEGLELLTNDSTDDWSKIISFIDLLNNNHSADFKQNLENSFDVHAYLKILAIEKCVRSFDSYWGGGNNFSLYEHPDGKIRWIPWDMNLTFQDIKKLSGTTLLDGYLIPTPDFESRPLIKRIFEIEEYKNEYLNDVCELIHSKFTLNNLGEFILYRHNLIDEAYKTDPYRYNSYESFNSSLTEDNEDVLSITTSAYVIRFNYPGIYPFIQSQRVWAVEQMKGWEHECSIEDNTIYNLFVYPNPASDYINILNDSSGFEYAQFKLYDFMGKLVRNSNYEVMQGNYYTLQLEGIPTGIYLLSKISADGRIGRAKIIIK